MEDTKPEIAEIRPVAKKRGRPKKNDSEAKPVRKKVGARRGRKPGRKAGRKPGRPKAARRATREVNIVAMIKELRQLVKERKRKEELQAELKKTKRANAKQMRTIVSALKALKKDLSR